MNRSQSKLPKTTEILEALKAIGTTAEDITKEASDSLVLLIGGRVVRVSFTQSSEIMVFESRTRVYLPKIANAAHVARAAAMVSELTFADAPASMPERKPRIDVNSVSGMSLYLARHILGNRKPILVLATNPASASGLAANHWGFVHSNVASDVATEAEAGRHQAVLTRQGLKPIEDVFQSLAVVR